MNFRIIALACAAVTMLCSAPFAASAAPASHCAADETIIFTCPVDGQKLASVCASREYGPDIGFLQYRFGPAGKPETVLPAAKTAPAKTARWGSWMFSGGGGAYVQFLDGKTAHYVYSAVGKWGENGETAEKAGVAVEKDGKVIANFLCRAPETSELGPEFFNKAGLPELEDEFEMPD